MKNKLNKILLITSSIIAVLILILAILGTVSKIGYLSEFKLNESLSKQYEYHYDFRIKYYSKIFRNSDIYGVYIDTNKVIKENGFLRDIKMQPNDSPFGNLISSKEFKYDDEINYINYKLKLKIYVWIVFIVCIIYILYNYKSILSIFSNKQLVLKILKISSISILSLLVLLFILEKLNHKANIEDLELITESNLGYVYKAKVSINNKGIFSPNLIWKYPNKVSFNKNIDYIKNGYNIDLNRQPDWYDTSVGALVWKNEDGSFSVSNSISWNGYNYDIITSKGEIYKISIEVKRIFSDDNNFIRYHLDNDNTGIPIPGTQYIKDEYTTYTSERYIKSVYKNSHNHFDFYFPRGLFNVKNIKIEQLSDNVYLKSGNIIVFTSSKKIDDINSIGTVNYKLHINNYLYVIVLIIIAITLLLYFIILPYNKEIIYYIEKNKLILVSASLLIIIQVFIYLSLYNYFRIVS